MKPASPTLIALLASRQFFTSPISTTSFWLAAGRSTIAAAKRTLFGTQSHGMRVER